MVEATGLTPPPEFQTNQSRARADEQTPDGKIELVTCAAVRRRPAR
jgi:hypothetical protein